MVLVLLLVVVVAVVTELLTDGEADDEVSA